ncbi:hypothetical protein [Streptomyces chilikensis]|uniref:Uncharacterized protein n=1 Tax=Streptomyces chilikensis TaxID=1194079 RepID=A0ABV3EK95_9ACTN
MGDSGFSSGPELGLGVEEEVQGLAGATGVAQRATRAAAAASSVCLRRA